MTTAIGLHNGDNYNVANQAFIWDTVRRLEPEAINLLLAQNAQQARELGIAIARDTSTKVFVRHHFEHLGQGDEQSIDRFPDPRDYARVIIRQYVGTNMILVAGNEILKKPFNDPQILTGEGHSMSQVGWIIQVMRYADELGVDLAVLRTPPWHPYRTEFTQFDEIVETYDIDGHNMIAVQGLRHAFQLWSQHYWSPNWYWSLDNFDAIRKGLEFWEYIGKPKIVTGEAGPMVAPGVLEGYISLGWTERQLADHLVDVWNQWFQPHNIPLLYFHALQWNVNNTMRVGTDFVDRLVERKAELQLSGDPTPEPPPIPDPEPPPNNCTELRAENARLRKQIQEARDILRG